MSLSFTNTPRAALGRGRLAGIAFVFLWFAIGGVAHFVATDTEMRIVPPYVPWPRAAVLVSGVFELLGAAGLLWAPTRRWAGMGLFVLTLAVTPAHIYMLQAPELFNVPYWLLVARLPVQVALLALIAWATFYPTGQYSGAPAVSARRRGGSAAGGPGSAIWQFVNRYKKDALWRSK